MRVVRADGWAYLRRSDGRLTLDGGKRVMRTEELYDLAHDPGEHEDLVARDPVALARLRALFDRRGADAAGRAGGGGAPAGRA